MRVELGNDHAEPYPSVAYLDIPEGRAGRLIGLDRLPDETDEEFERRDAEHVAANEGDFLYSMPDEHDDDVFFQNDATRHIAEALSAVKKDQRLSVRRSLVNAHMSDPSTPGLPDHAAFVVVADPVNGELSSKRTKA